MKYNKLCCELNGYKSVPDLCTCKFKVCKECQDRLATGNSKYFKGYFLLADAHYEFDSTCKRFEELPRIESNGKK